MNRRALLFPISLLFSVAGFQGQARAQEPEPSARIQEFTVRCRDATVTVSFRVEGPFTPTIQEKLISASNVKFVHKIGLYRRRLLLPDRLLAERTVETSVRYDNLSGDYSLSRAIDGVNVKTGVTQSEEEMRRFMTEVRDLALAGGEPLRPGKTVSVRVRSEYEETWLLFLFPWTYAAKDEKDVTCR